MNDNNSYRRERNRDRLLLLRSLSIGHSSRGDFNWPLWVISLWVEHDRARHIEHQRVLRRPPLSFQPRPSTATIGFSFLLFVWKQPFSTEFGVSIQRLKDRLNRHSSTRIGFFVTKDFEIEVRLYDQDEPGETFRKLKSECSSMFAIHSPRKKGQNRGRFLRPIWKI